LGNHRCVAVGAGALEVGTKGEEIKAPNAEVEPSMLASSGTDGILERLIPKLPPSAALISCEKVPEASVFVIGFFGWGVTCGLPSL
jgi:hypothetical protein